MIKGHEAAPVSKAQARKTAFVVAGVFLLIAGWNYYRGRLTVVVVFGSLAALLIISGLMIPSLARRFHTFWMRVAVTLGWINSRILLGLMFYGAFTPYNLIGRLVGRDALRRRGGKKTSYWIPRKSPKQTREQFERTF